MQIEIQIFLSDYDNKAFFERLGKIIDLENNEFTLEVDVELDDYNDIDFSFNSLNYKGLEFNIPNHLKSHIVNDCYNKFFEHYHDLKDSCEADKYDHYRQENCI